MPPFDRGHLRHQLITALILYSMKWFRRTILPRVVKLFLIITFLSAGEVLFSAISKSSTLLPITIGGIAAAVGLICNLTFTYAKTVEEGKGKLADELNRRAGRLLVCVIALVLSAIASVGLLGLKEVNSKSLLYLLAAPAQYFLHVMIAAGIIVSLLYALFGGIYIVNFINSYQRRKETLNPEECVSGFERRIETLFKIADEPENRRKAKRQLVSVNAKE